MSHKHRPMDFNTFDKAFEYNADIGKTYHKTDKGQKNGAGAQVKAGDTADFRHYTVNGYRHIRHNNEDWQAHRVAWLLYFKEDPGEFEVDHINQLKNDNRIANLRLVDAEMQAKNRSRRSDNTSGIMGVNWNNDVGKWLVRVNKDKSRKSLGYFEDFFEACCARKSAENRLGYHPNHGK